jgi:hypothetical protein
MKHERKNYTINGVRFSKEQMMYLGSVMQEARDEALDCLYDEQSSASDKERASKKAARFKKMLAHIAPAAAHPCEGR